MFTTIHWDTCKMKQGSKSKEYRRKKNEEKFRTFFVWYDFFDFVFIFFYFFALLTERTVIEKKIYYSNIYNNRFHCPFMKMFIGFLNPSCYRVGVYAVCVVCVCSCMRLCVELCVFATMEALTAFILCTYWRNHNNKNAYKILYEMNKNSQYLSNKKKIIFYSISFLCFLFCGKMKRKKEFREGWNRSIFFILPFLSIYIDVSFIMMIWMEWKIDGESGKLVSNVTSFFSCTTYDNAYFSYI